MALTNQERVGKAMYLLRAGLASFVERDVHAPSNDAACAWRNKFAHQEPFSSDDAEVR